MVADDPNRWVLLQQFKNPANPDIHFKTTGPEIWDDTDGTVDVLVSGVGTGGTITGVSRYIKGEKGKKILSDRRRAGAQPGDHADAEGRGTEAGSAQDSGHRRGVHSGHARSVRGRRVELVNNDESIEMARRLAKEEGILSGISCGAAVVAAMQVAKRAGIQGQDDRGDPAGFGGALSQFSPVRRHVRGIDGRALPIQEGRRARHSGVWWERARR